MIERKKITPILGVTMPKADPLAIARFNSRSYAGVTSEMPGLWCEYVVSIHTPVQGVTALSVWSAFQITFQFTLLYKE